MFRKSPYLLEHIQTIENNLNKEIKEQEINLSIFGGFFSYY